MFEVVWQPSSGQQKRCHIVIDDNDDSDDNDEYVCNDYDGDTCDECSSGSYASGAIGPDTAGAYASTNNATLGGHVTVGVFAILGGLSAVHQFCRVGAHAMVGGMSGVDQDVIPYGSVMGNRARLSGLNVVGLRRRAFSRREVQTLRTAYRLLFAEEGTLSERLADVAEMYRSNAVVMEIVEFIQADSSRAICQPRAGDAA